MSSSTAPKPAKVPKPQSLPAITRSAAGKEGCKEAAAGHARHRPEVAEETELLKPLSRAEVEEGGPKAAAG